jgi:hypothetical protein
MGYQWIYIASEFDTMIKEDALIKAMVDAIVAPSDEESNEASQLAMQIARNMKMGDVIECQKKALDIVNKANQLEQSQESTTIH